MIGRACVVRSLTSLFLLSVATTAAPQSAWAKKLTKAQLGHKFVWHAVYVGEQGHRPGVSPVHTLKVG